MIRRTFFALLLAAPFLPAQTQAPAPEAEAAPPVFRTDVSLITVDAKVTRRDGSDAGNLSASDFVILDEGQRQTISHFGSESTSIDLLLLLDVSDSMRPFLLELTPRVTEALSPLRQGDRGGVMLFAGRSQLVQPLTDDLAQVPRKTVSTIYKDGLGRSTLINEALVNAAQYLKSQPATGRRTIIVLTDNEASQGPVLDDQVIRELHGADAVLNVILLGVTDPNEKIVRGYQDRSRRRPNLHSFAEATGGDVITGEAPARALRRVIEQATTRYSLQYPSPGGEPGAVRNIRVELSGAAAAKYPGAIIRARSGYEVPK